MCVINIKNLNKSIGESKVLKDITLSINFDIVPTIIGPSGSGKSTLLRCINQLKNATFRNIYFHNTDLTLHTTNFNKIRVKIGMSFQSFNLFDNMTMLKNYTIG